MDTARDGLLKTIATNCVSYRMAESYACYRIFSCMNDSAYAFKYLIFN